MAKICYVKKRICAANLAIIKTVNDILDEYEKDGIDLTVRQCFYQFVSRALLPNTTRDYKRLASIIDDGRMAGLIDWNRIQDRTRFLRVQSAWGEPADIIRTCSRQYKEDLWRNQPNRIEVWIEKDAGIGNIEAVCEQNRVPYLSCRGYTSQSEMWRAAQRLEEYSSSGQNVHIIHLGDHDPSGIDMSRDIQDRLNLFAPDAAIEVHRIALNMDQVEEHEPPPNPAKLTDSRCDGYIAKFGDESWELDAMPPRLIRDLIANEIDLLREADTWNSSVKEEELHRAEIKRISDNYDGVIAFLDKKRKDDLYS